MALSVMASKASKAVKASSVIAAVLLAAAAAAQPAQGGLYIAGDGFSFETAAQRGLAQNPGGRRFFLLTLPPEAGALRRRAPASQARLRDRVVAANGVLLVCQRDLDNSHIDAGDLVAEVVAVRGWPPKARSAGNAANAAGQRYFPGEDRSVLPASNQALRTLRAACS
jgi:hypothetical protein